MATRLTDPILRTADAVDAAISRLCQLVLLATGIVLMGALTANVIARYVLATGGFDWAEEVPEQLFPWFIMAGVALAVQHRGHVAVEWLLGKLGRTSTRLLLIAGHLLVIATYAVLVQQALFVGEIVAIELTPVLGLPKTYGYWAIAMGSALLAISTLADLARLVRVGPEALQPPAGTEVAS